MAITVTPSRVQAPAALTAPRINDAQALSGEFKNIQSFGDQLKTNRQEKQAGQREAVQFIMGLNEFLSTRVAPEKRAEVAAGLMQRPAVRTAANLAGMQVGGTVGNTPGEQRAGRLEEFRSEQQIRQEFPRASGPGSLTGDERTFNRFLELTINPNRTPDEEREYQLRLRDRSYRQVRDWTESIIRNHDEVIQGGPLTEKKMREGIKIRKITSDMIREEFGGGTPSTVTPPPTGVGDFPIQGR